MKEKRIKRKKSQIMMARSRIYGFFLKAASFLFEKSEKSLAAKIFTGYDETSFEKSIICRFFKIFKLDRIFFRPLKRNTSKYVSQSYIVGKLDDFFQGFLHTKLNVYGLLLITTGIGLLFVELLKVYTSRLSFLSYIDIFVCVFLILISLPLLFSSSSFNSAVCKSKIAQYVMFQWFGFKREAFESDNGTEGYTKIAIPLGIILCVLSWWASPSYIVTGIVLLIFALALIYSPESGIVLLCLLLPFLTLRRLCVLTVYILLCFIMKYIRGKRTVKFDPLSTAVLMFGIFVFFSYRIYYASSYSSSAFIQILCSLCVFFLTVNMIKSKKWIDRCMKSLGMACLLTGLYGIILYVCVRYEIRYLSSLFNSITLRHYIFYFDDVTLLAKYLLLVLPFAAINIKINVYKHKVFSFISFVIGLLCLGTTRDQKTVVCLIFAFAFMMLLYSKRSFASLMFYVCSVPIVCWCIKLYLFDNSAIANAVSRLLPLHTSDTAYSYQYSNGHAGALFYNMLTDTGDRLNVVYTAILPKLSVHTVVFGIIMFSAVLFLCFQKNITLYSKGCSDRGKLFSLASMAAVFALLCTGTQISFSQDYRVTFMFWLCMGFVSCVAGTERNNVCEKTDL